MAWDARAWFSAQKAIGRLAPWNALRVMATTKVGLSDKCGNYLGLTNVEYIPWTSGRRQARGLTLFLFSETFRSFVRNCLKASVIFSFSNIFYDWKITLWPIALIFLGYFKKTFVNGRTNTKKNNKETAKTTNIVVQVFSKVRPGIEPDVLTWEASYNIALQHSQNKLKSGTRSWKL